MHWSLHSTTQAFAQACTHTLLFFALIFITQSLLFAEIIRHEWLGKLMAIPVGNSSKTITNESDVLATYG